MCVCNGFRVSNCKEYFRYRLCGSRYRVERSDRSDLILISIPVSGRPEDGYVRVVRSCEAYVPE